ncbi:MAG: hypothetical protein QXU20_01985 [Candidatus Woesearchaeota archaeon]
MALIQKKEESQTQQPQPVPKKQDATPQNLAPDFSNISRRVRMLEERYTKIQNRLHLTEENMLEFNKKMSVEIKTITSELDEMKHEINEIKDRILLIVKELKLCAKKDDVNVLKKYIELWEPLKFVTREDVEKMIREQFGKQ